MHTWLPGLSAAPLVWVDTRHANRPAEATLDFAGCLARAVPGETWLELKNSIHDRLLPFPEDLRWRCVAIAVGPVGVRAGGHHSRRFVANNIVIDLEAGPDRPALYLIDFDAFVAPAAGGNAAVTVAEGGTFGTEGYCPPDLPAAAAGGDGSAAPYSDRYARDMLLVELLLIESGLSPDNPPSVWSHETLQRRGGWLARGDPGCLQTLSHLDPATVFTLAEKDRPPSAELAARLGLSLPPGRLLRRMTRALEFHARRAWSSRLCAANRSPGDQQPLACATPDTFRILVPWRWSRPGSRPGNTTLWQDIKVAAIVTLPFILFLIIGLLSLLFGK